ncbi:spermine/spermidine synthase domain-containing protein [Undibacterium oligocarboniphilum]|uniref:Spermidine synthase n=1 Tax=Undibacterium oligocarboniphilum TaxID=666702 RepID=A0A850QJT1_9BURK|nr:methyltransferase [Undibacterium oligocarboniphilum]MBC3870941.1 spermidine synthase [Undibacterium oligocarboniphilum]NVO76436.1 spermidine synthase [Undibacterium oligocarboniphilum]
MNSHLTPYLQMQADTLPEVTISEHLGVRSLHLSSDAIQGSMRMAMPDQIELEYVQQMMMWLLFRQEPRHVVQLGLGAAALTKFCYRQFPRSRVTAVELNPHVIHACHQHFRLPDNDERLQVLNMDALDFVHDTAQQGSIDVMQVDLYDAAAEAPALSSRAFYQACADCLTAEGILTVNLFGNAQNYAANCDANLEALQDAFDAVVWLPLVHDANTVAMAFKQAPVVDFDVLYQRATDIRLQMKLPAAKWVKGLKAWMLQQC